MISVNKLIRITAKVAFKNIHKKGVVYCNSIKSDVIITNFFWKHISGNAKYRSSREVVIRLSCIVMLELIIKDGYISQKRTKPKIGGKIVDKSYRISYAYSGILFHVILSYYNNNHYIVSVFVDNKKRVR